jgi:hypothetical protein
MSEVAPSVRCTAFATGVPGTQGSLVIPTTVQPGDCLLLAADGIPLGTTGDVHHIGYTMSGEPFGWQRLTSLTPTYGYPGPPNVWWKTATASDAGSTVLAYVFGAAGLLAYQNSGGSVPWVIAPLASYTDLVFAPVAPSVPVSATVLEIYAIIADAPSTASPTMSLPATAEGQIAAYTIGGGLGAPYDAIGFSDQAQTVAGPSATLGGVTSAGATSGTGITVVIPAMLASYAPTLLTPAGNSTLDLALSQPFTWGYNPSLNCGPQVAYAFRRKVAGATSYEYWSAGAGTWGAITWNSSAVGSVTFPVSKWVDGNVYNWSVATQDSITGLQGAFAQDFIVTAQQSASVVVNTPSGYTIRFDPTITWTATFPGSFVQIGYRAVVYSAAQYGAAGFTPGVGPSAWDSGVIAGTATSAFPLIPGTYNGSTMRAYVQVTETNNAVSPWAYSTFALEVDAPAAPTLTAAPGTDGVTGAPLVAVTLNGHDNLLTPDDASVEATTGTWVAGANTTIARSSAQAADGFYSLSLTATAGGSVSAVTGPYPVIH